MAGSMILILMDVFFPLHGWLDGMKPEKSVESVLFCFNFDILVKLNPCGISGELVNATTLIA